MGGKCHFLIENKWGNGRVEMAGEFGGSIDVGSGQVLKGPLTFWAEPELDPF